MKNDAIAVTDSGIGGIVILNALRVCLPNENYIYFADNRGMPYGDKGNDELIALAKKNLEFLIKQRVKAVVLACNTITAVAVKHLRDAFPETVIIGTEPNIKQAAADLNAGERALVLVTRSTKDNLNYKEKFPYRKKYDVVALPYLAAAIEEELPLDLVKTRLTDDLSPYKGKCKCAVLGCTHYRYVGEEISRALGGVPVYDGTEGVVKQTEKRLSDADLLQDSGKKGALTLLFSNPIQDMYKKYMKYIK